MAEPEKEEIEQPGQEAPGQEPAPQTDPDQVRVNIEELDDDTDAGGPVDPAIDRKTRRAQHRELKQALQERDKRIEEMSRQLAEINGRMSQQAQQQPQYVQVPPPVPEQTEEEAAIATIEETQRAINAAVGNPQLSEAQVQALTKEWNKHERKKNELIAKAVIKREMSSQQMSDETIQTRILQNEFSHIYANPVLRASASTEMEYLCYNLGRPRNAATAREALQRVHARLQPPRTAAPTDAQRSKYTSTPGRAGASAGGNGSHFTPTKAQLNAARGYTAHLNDLTDEERVRKWVKDVGKPTGLVS